MCGSNLIGIQEPLGAQQLLFCAILLVLRSLALFLFFFLGCFRLGTQPGLFYGEYFLLFSKFLLLQCKNWPADAQRQQ